MRNGFGLSVRVPYRDYLAGVGSRVHGVHGVVVGEEGRGGGYWMYKDMKEDCFVKFWTEKFSFLLKVNNTFFLKNGFLNHTISAMFNFISTNSQMFLNSWISV